MIIKSPLDYKSEFDFEVQYYLILYEQKRT